MEDDKKGIFGDVTFGSDYFNGEWNLRLIDLNKQFDVVESDHDGLRGGVYTAKINVSNPADTFLDMRDFIRGYVFINGINLGRYWTTDNNWQKSMYVPGVWIKNGLNEIVVVETVAEDKLEGSITGTSVRPVYPE